MRLRTKKVRLIIHESFEHISDRGMPNITGDQLARELILIKPGIPVIICTGFSNENDERRAMAMGIKGFPRKPVSLNDMAAMVRNVLDEGINFIQKPFEVPGL
jgi:DNA-binding NarL/FixJ family response regulator